MKIRTIFIVLSLVATSLQSQSKIDSIMVIWKDETKSDTIRLKAMRSYFFDNYYRLPADSLYILSEMQYTLAESKNQKLFMANAMVWQGISQKSKGEHVSAMNSYLRALKIMEDLGDKKEIALSLYWIGEAYQEQGMFTKALEYYQRGYKIDNVLGNKLGLANYYTKVGTVYSRLDDCSKAMEYHKKSLTLYEELNDTFYISGALNNIGVAYQCQKKYSKALEYFLRSLKIDETLGDQEGIIISLNNIGECYRENNDYMQALDYFKKAQKLQEKMGGIGITSELLRNIGMLYIKQGHYKKAVVECEKSLKIAKEMESIQFQKNACECLYTSYKEVDRNKALDYFEQLNILNDSLKSQSTIKNMQNLEFAKQLEIDSIAQVAKDAKVEMAHQTEVRKKDKNKNIAMVAGIFFLLLSGGLYSRWRYVKKSKAVIEKEKDRSDTLLLNILPAEIAEELKSKGKADARDFEMVSILFSDFKNFTGHSEQMTAKDLVANINICFEAFDNIMQKYNIEKIKTIGDAYMAAGGLPIHSDDSVKRTVLAALEMQAFISELGKEKQSKGEHTFEMRVGIHTGSVVAGIVGVKKFQYDIWGDTVNTASRMESHGEIGKVNISQNTYNYIKDEPEFAFEYRGKIEAKGKGEVEMYFVNLK